MNTEWLSDENGNRASVAYFGSREAAQKALDSLINCKNCTNCSDCSDCSHISRLVLEENLHPEPTVPADGGPVRYGPPDAPKIDGIHQKVFAAVSQPEALDMGAWHTCNTTHCRAGWVVTRAGPTGKELETFFGTENAAMQIYKASGYLINPARFYDDNASALADMKRLAEEGA